jgi:catechol 2,3-dioxygenase-like lactoylglutathione lyase family enzyme
MFSLPRKNQLILNIFKNLSVDLITGIQQVGIGVKDAGEAFKWYNKTFGLNVPVFDDEAQAKLMVKYTNNVVRTRRAILAVNMAGGGGAEIWESRSPLPLEHTFQPELGDLGIFAIKIKAQKVADFANNNNLKAVQNPVGADIVWTSDPYGNVIQVVADDSWFKPSVSNTGGVLGAIIGVSDMDVSLKLYQNLLGLTEKVYDKTGIFEDLSIVEGGKNEFRRVVLRKKQAAEGAFTKLFGNIEIELIQKITGGGRPIFQNRSWGDLGYVHLCFDAIDMNGLGEKLLGGGFPFVVDSANSFDMGDAAGRFTYITDPDGTLLEFVETHKVPILKKIGWYINLKKRKTQNPLPDWMVNTIGWGKVKA